MNKSSIIILVIAAVVFAGLGFVVGQVMAEGSNPGSANDPVVSQSYVDELVGVKVTELQNQIDNIQTILGGGTVENPGASGDAQTVTVTSDSVNIRESASTSASIVATVSEDTVLSYLEQTSATDGIWYKVATSGGSEGWLRSDLCTSPE